MIDDKSGREKIRERSPKMGAGDWRNARQRNFGLKFDDPSVGSYLYLFNNSANTESPAGNLITCFLTNCHAHDVSVICK